MWPTVDDLKDWLRIPAADTTDDASLAEVVAAAISATKDLTDVVWHGSPPDHVRHACLDYAAALWRQRTPGSVAYSDGFMESQPALSVLRSRVASSRAVDFA